MLQLLIQDIGGHLVCGMILSPGIICYLLVPLNGTALSLEVLLQDGLNIRINRLVIVATTQAGPL